MVTICSISNSCKIQDISSGQEMANQRICLPVWHEHQNAREDIFEVPLTKSIVLKAQITFNIDQSHVGTLSELRSREFASLHYEKQSDICISLGR